MEENNKSLSDNKGKSNLFGAFSFFISLIFICLLTYLIIYFVISNFEITPLLIIVISIIFSFIYYLFELKKQRKMTIQQILKKKMSGVLDTIRTLFSTTFSIAKFLFKAALVVGIISLVIWLIIAVGPLWIIAIVSVAILLILANQRR